MDTGESARAHGTVGGPSPCGRILAPQGPECAHMCGLAIFGNSECELLLLIHAPWPVNGQLREINDISLRQARRRADSIKVGLNKTVMDSLSSGPASS